MTDFRNRIIATREMSPSDLIANPKNWRKHPALQQKAIEAVLDDVGWVAQVIWNEATGHLIDGHLRVEVARKRKEKSVPVNVVNMTQQEEDAILATFDPISAMAVADNAVLNDLISGIAIGCPDTRQLLDSLATPVEEFETIGDMDEGSEPYHFMSTDALVVIVGRFSGWVADDIDRVMVKDLSDKALKLPEHIRVDIATKLCQQFISLAEVAVGALDEIAAEEDE